MNEAECLRSGLLGGRQGESVTGVRGTHQAPSRDAPQVRGGRIAGRWRHLWKVLRRDRLAVAGGAVVVAFVLAGLLAPALAPHNPNAVNLGMILQTPTLGYWLGTDNHGRDILSRILFGARLSLLVGTGAVGLGLVAGVLAGLLAGYYDRLQGPLMRLMDVLLAFPGIVVALTIVAILGPGEQNVILAVGISQIPQFARIVNGMVLTIREDAYVEAARAIGASDPAILGRHIFPNTVAPLIVQASLLIPAAILTASSLSFLGAGIQPPTAEWGAMLSDSRRWMQVAPHLMIFPGIALMLVVLGFNVFGDGLRDALDPRLRGSSASAER
ncbi:MAG: ABC transporter permease [Armatimonadetes bacterium]|nr:ABC transporter permease [Armatimonadota bacterium]